MRNQTLKNNLIIAMPQLNDTIFNESVILLNEFNSDGAMGFIINKPISSDISSSIIFNKAITNKIKKNIYFGGPVELNSCFILHDNSYRSDDTKSINNELNITSNKKIIDDIVNKKGPKKFLMEVGYAGWEKGQLEKEIKNGDWLVLPNPQNFIFNIPYDDKWSHLIHKLGINDKNDWISSGGQA